MVEVERLPARERAPRNICFDVVGEWRVRPTVLDQARPHGAVDKAPRLALDILEGRADATILLSQMHQRDAGLFFHILVRPIRQFAIGHGGKMQDHIADVDIFLERRIDLTSPFLSVVRLNVLVILFLDRILRAVSSQSVFSGHRSIRDKLLIDILVVALDDVEGRHRLAGNRVALAP